VAKHFVLLLHSKDCLHEPVSSQPNVAVESIFSLLFIVVQVDVNIVARMRGDYIRRVLD
jgi:hypothetical protein